MKQERSLPHIGPRALAAGIASFLGVMAAAQPSMGASFPTDRGQSEVEWSAADVQVRADKRFTENCTRELGKECKPEIFMGTLAADMHQNVVMVTNDWGEIQEPERRLLCSGTLIQARVVLTAGHCIDYGIHHYVLFGNGANLDAKTVKDRGGDIHVFTAAGAIAGRFMPVYKYKRMTTS